MAYIYKITNKINNKIYICKKEFSIEKRWIEHIQDSKREYNLHRPLYRAFNKYGINNFTIETIEETDNPIDREKYWIEYYGSFKDGYNATKGGDGKPYLDYDLIIKTYKEVQNCSAVAKLLDISAESVSKVLHKYNINVVSGAEVTKKLTSRPVAQIDPKTDEVIAIFSSVKEAERALSFTSHSHIPHVCQGKRKTCKGYKWKYI